VNDFVVQTTVLPPSAAGSTLVYAWALFGMLLICTGSISMIWHIGCAMRWFRMGITNPLAHLRFKECLFFLTFVLLTLGEIPVLLLWGEVNNGTMTTLNLLKRVLQGSALIPVGVAILMFLRSEGAMIEQLTRGPPPRRLYVSWKSIRQYLRIGFTCALLAALVAIGKASV